MPPDVTQYHQMPDCNAFTWPDTTRYQMASGGMGTCESIAVWHLVVSGPVKALQSGIWWYWVTSGGIWWYGDL